MAELIPETLRRRDPDRYFTALFAPAGRREALWTLYAFNHELARAHEAARESGLALIRLQWWREVVEGARRAHDVAAPLHEALGAGILHQADLLAMIEAREQEVEAPAAGAESWRDWLLLGSGSLAVAAGRALGAPENAFARLRALGAGYGAAGQLRNVGALARHGRCLMPQALLASHGLDEDAVIAAPESPGMLPVRRALAEIGRGLLGRPQRCARSWVAAALPAVLARRDLADAGRTPGPRTTGDRLAIVSAALRAQA